MKCTNECQAMAGWSPKWSMINPSILAEYTYLGCLQNYILIHGSYFMIIPIPKLAKFVSDSKWHNWVCLMI